MVIRVHRNIPSWLAAVILCLAAICLAGGTLFAAFSIWLPHTGPPSDLIIQACVGRVLTTAWWGVWWAVPGIAAMPPPSIASRQAVCGYVPRPLSWAQQGSFSLLP